MAKPETLQEAENLLQALLTSHLLLYTDTFPEERNRREEQHAQLFQRLAHLIADSLEQEFF